MSNEKDKKGRFKKGNSGRPVGAENKFSQLKDAFLDAFYDKDGFNGVEGLKNWLKESSRNKALFVQMVTKMLPSNLTLKGDEDSPVIKIQFVEVASKDQGGNSKKKKKPEAQKPTGAGASK